MTIASIAFDGSENAMRAIDEVVDTMDTSKLHVHLLNVCEPVQINEVVFNKEPLLDMLSIKKAREEAGTSITDARESAPRKCQASRSMRMCAQWQSRRSHHRLFA
jgi:nucleotide-binding universal stress UspA family protein